MTSPLTTEASLVALTLSAVVRLQLAFEASASPSERSRLLQAAGDVLDRTTPYPDLKATLPQSSNVVDTLVQQRARVAAVPPGLWRKPNVRPNELEVGHYSGMRNVERALRKDTSDPERLWRSLETWLAPAWERYPALKSEVLALKASP